MTEETCEGETCELCGDPFEDWNPAAMCKDCYIELSFGREIPPTPSQALALFLTDEEVRQVKEIAGPWQESDPKTIPVIAWVGAMLRAGIQARMEIGGLTREVRTGGPAPGGPGPGDQMARIRGPRGMDGERGTSGSPVRRRGH